MSSFYTIISLMKYLRMFSIIFELEIVRDILPLLLSLTTCFLGCVLAEMVIISQEEQGKQPEICMEVLDESRYGEFQEIASAPIGILHQELKMNVVYPECRNKE